MYEKALKKSPKDSALASKVGQTYVRIHHYNKVSEPHFMFLSIHLFLTSFLANLLCLPPLIPSLSLLSSPPSPSSTLLSPSSRPLSLCTSSSPLLFILFQAINYYEASLKSNDLFTLRYDLTNLYFKLHQYDKAERTLLTALERDPGRY